MANIMFSVITVCYNSEKTILNTINSVLSQNFENFEYIIIDGGSTDNTVSYINKYKNKFENFKFISEKDNGIYDAMNKGIELSNGEYIHFLNSDDHYTNKNVLKTVNNYLSDSNIEIFYGNTLFINSKGKLLRIVKSGSYKYGSFKKGWFPFHPSTFFKKEIFERIGKYNINFKISADFDFFLKAFEKYNINSQYVDIPLVYMVQGGKSTGKLKNILKGIIECKNSFKSNDLKSSNIYVLRRIIYICSQYIYTLFYKMKAILIQD